jgi:predicted dehydrogenase
VGLIGCGNFAYTTIAYYLEKNYRGAMRAAMDTDINKAVSLYSRYNLAYYTSDASQILKDPQIDLVFIASDHASHADYAVQALEQGKSVHIEKPHAVTMEQLERLCSAMHEYGGSVALGFNRPVSPIGKKIKECLSSQAGAAFYNWFVAGHDLPPDHWYFAENEGGRVIGNLCHWTDFTYQLIPETGRYPITIVPAGGAKPHSDMVVTYLFGDGSISVISFSVKSDPFEGIRERFTGHRGRALICMDDFKNLTIDVGHKKHKIRRLFRDQGHEANIKRSYEMVSPQRGGSSAGSSIEYVWETGELFLKTREALKLNKTITLEPYRASLSGNRKDDNKRDDLINK